MTERETRAIMDGNEAVAYVAYRLSELCLVCPVPPATAMAEHADHWATLRVQNLWGGVPHVEPMPGAGGVAGALHGALQTGTLATTFSASQALLRMIPCLYRIAGELSPAVVHVATGSVSGQGAASFGDHSDVMAVRQTGVGMLASSTVQEAHDLAAIAHATSLETSIPFIHFFDGFRTSHEIHDIDRLQMGDLRGLVNDDAISRHRSRALRSDAPTTRGTGQNPDVFFQAREASGAHYAACPDQVQEVMDRFGAITGRSYRLVEYAGHPEATDLLVLMGSGGETARETVIQLAAEGRRVGMVKVRLYRPFDPARLCAAIPSTVQRLAVLDRTKEPGAVGEPLYLDVVAALSGRVPSAMALVRGGRYGLGGKSFTPDMVEAVLRELEAPSVSGSFTIGIEDDLTQRSLPVRPGPARIHPQTTQAVFYGMAADGTVSANRQTIRIIGRETGHHVQAYFLYDSKRAGSLTMSHVRFGPHPISAPYLVEQADFIGCHHFPFVHRFDLLKRARSGATLLINSPFSPDESWDRMPRTLQACIIDQGLRVFVIDACGLARRLKLGTRIGAIMQTGFFALSDVLPCETALNRIKGAIRWAYGKKGRVVIERNWQAVDDALEALREMTVPAHPTAEASPGHIIPEAAPPFVKTVTSRLIAHQGHTLPVSALPVDGVWPTATSAYEKRRISQRVPVWNPEACLQCGQCVLMCPHACIRAKHVSATSLRGAPERFPVAGLIGQGVGGRSYALQIYEDDCTGCGVCIEICPARSRDRGGARALVLEAAAPRRTRHHQEAQFFDTLPVPDPATINVSSVRGVQFLPSRFEFSGACAGCGETPYLSLLTQLFGERLLIANAAGCSSVFGGHLPTSPWTTDAAGRGPAWAASLDADSAEFGYGFRLSLDTRDDADTGQSVWIVGGDGWAHGDGFAGLDHVLTSVRNVNVLVLDTEICSSTGGQASKATPCGVVGKFEARGKGSPKRDIARIGLDHDRAYVAQVALGANPQQCIRAFREAEAYHGPSLILAYCPCIAHGFSLNRGTLHQQLAVHSGHWPLFRFHPDLTDAPRLVLDSLRPALPFDKFAYSEVRFNLLPRIHPERSRELLARCQKQVAERWAYLEGRATRHDE